MVGDSEYAWRLIADAADSVDRPLRHYPYLVEALDRQGVSVEMDWPADVVRQRCHDLLVQRMVQAGEDS